jgi:hypothetical protein
LDVVDEIEQVIKSDRRPPQGSEVIVPHSHILRRATWIRSSAPGASRCPRRAREGRPTAGDLAEFFAISRAKNRSLETKRWGAGYAP